MIQTSAYQQLQNTWTRIHRFNHLLAIAGWDQAAKMPEKGNDARSEAIAEVSTLIHGMMTDPKLGSQIKAAEDEALTDDQRANLREMKISYIEATAIPAEIVTKKSIAASKCEHAWRTQRKNNDWKSFAPNLREVVAIAREEAALRCQMTGLSKYEAMLQLYEPGMTVKQIDSLFGDLRTWLPGLIDKVIEKQKKETVIQLSGPYAIEKQHALSTRIVKLLGFDFEAGRLDLSTHPFCGGVPEDVRMTTRFSETNLLDGIFGTVHETGHGRYEQGLPREWLGQPLATATSMGLHESQSLSFENQLGRSRHFVKRLAPMLVETFGNRTEFETENLLKLVTRVERGFIRTASDEITYPAHVILRYSIERPLLEGEIDVDDIPALWDAGMKELLGMDTRGNFKDGPMQDVHWPSGSIGYFPSYTLGAMYAAQWGAAMRKAIPDLDVQLADGNWAAMFKWLETNVWTQGRRYSSNDLATRASGETLNAIHFRRHLEERYL